MSTGAKRGAQSRVDQVRSGAPQKASEIPDRHMKAFGVSRTDRISPNSHRRPKEHSK